MTTQINLIQDTASIEAFIQSPKGMDLWAKGAFFDTVVSDCITRLAEMGIDCPDSAHLLAFLRTDAIAKNRGVEILVNHLDRTLRNKEINQGKIDFFVAKASPRVQWERKDDEDKDIVIRDFTDTPTPKDMKFINLTPHNINVAGANGEIVTIPTSGLEARREEQHTPQPSIDGVSCFAMSFGEVFVQDKEGNRSPFPDPEEDTFFIVSATTMMAMPHRKDVIAPYKVDRETRIAEGFSVNS